MHFNGDELADFASSAGDIEGRLTHKPPPRTLYDSAYKERWFKLKANFLFYYRLNEFGGVEKNEPSGVFVLENIEVNREETSDAPFGFAIKWKEDLERKHMFFAKSEANAIDWVNKLLRASYEHLRAQMVMLRVHIRRRTGKDPLEHLGPPVPMQAPQVPQAPMAPKVPASCKSVFHVDLGDNHSLDLPDSAAQEYSSYGGKRSGRSPSRSSLSLKSPSLKFKIPKSPSLRQPSRSAPVPPPRKGKKQTVGNGQIVVQDLIPGIGGNRASFRCHVDDNCPPSKPNNLLD